MEWSEKPLMRCCLCHERFSDADCDALDYFQDAGICFKCYEAGKRKPHNAWCFGKETVGAKLGYDPFDRKNRSCTEWCPDRKYCALFVSGEIYKLRQLAKEV